MAKNGETRIDKLFEFPRFVFIFQQLINVSGTILARNPCISSSC